MIDNTKRGKRALFWLKVFFFLVLIIMVGLFYVSCGVNPTFMTGDNFPIMAVMMSGALLLLVAMFLLFFCFFLHKVFWLMWLYRAEENLREIGTTLFPSWASVILSLIPLIGLPLHYFIFKDVVARTEKILEARGVLPRGRDVSPEKSENVGNPRNERVSAGFMNTFMVCAILSSVSLYLWKDTNIYIGSFLGLIALACYIRAFSVFVHEEKILFDLHQEDVLNAKVDRILREREILKAASEVHRAKYDP